MTAHSPLHFGQIATVVTALTRMPCSYTSKEEKVHIPTLKEQNVPIKEICTDVGLSKATIYHLLAAACSKPPDVTLTY